MDRFFLSDIFTWIHINLFYIHKEAINLIPDKSCKICKGKGILGPPDEEGEYPAGALCECGSIETQQIGLTWLGRLLDRIWWKPI